MTPITKHQILNFLIATVWFINGLFCKVLNLVPRHQEIVAAILGHGHSRLMTVLIGFSEIAMTVWILSGVRTRFNAITQIIVIAAMNILEFILVPERLLWGRANALFALTFILVIFYNEFHLNKKLAAQT
jgi:hypothetical protein